MARFKNEHILAPVSVPCYDWKGDNGETSRKTVIISPIRIIESGNGNIQISWGCSRGAFCKDQNCRYSHAAEQDGYTRAPAEHDGF